MLKSLCLISCIYCTLISPAITAPTSKFDEFSFSDCESLVARLDNFAIAVSEYRQAVGLVYVYGGKVTRKGEREMYQDTIRNYLIKRRHVDSHRLRVLWGGYRESAGAEIWIVPPGAALPNPSPSFDERKVVFKKQLVGRSAYRCARTPWK
jgi:hypothetical protein